MSVDDSLLRFRRWVLAPSSDGPFAAHGGRVFRSTDVDETHKELVRIFDEHELRVVGADKRLDAVLAAWGIGDVTLAYVKHGAEVIVGPGRPESHYAVVATVKGTSVWQSGRRNLIGNRGSAVVLSATPEITMRRSADREDVTVRVDLAALQRELSRRLRREINEPLVFHPAMRLTTGAGRGWAATLRFVLDEIRHGTGSLTHPLVRSRVDQLFIEQLILGQRHNFSDELGASSRAARRPAVVLALEILQDRAADPLTIPMLAELVGVSVRSLQQGFRDYLGATPLECLRELRLARVRDDLLAAHDQDGPSVREVAYCWGFVHLARFAGYYKHRFAELPSETVRRR